MKLLLFFHLSLCFLTGCGQFKSAKIEPSNVDPAFETILTRYKNDKVTYLGTSNTARIDILFYTQEYPVIAVCIRSGNNRTILVDPYYWVNSSIYDQITVFYHEMGHCDLGIWEHSDTPTIMNEYVLDGNTFRSNETYYLEELFLNRR